MKLNIGPVTYDIYTQNLRIDVVPGTYDVYPQMMLINMWFVYLIGWFVHYNSWLNLKQALHFIHQGLLLWEYTYHRKRLKKPPDPWRRFLLFLTAMIINVITISTYELVLRYIVGCYLDE